MKTLLAFAIFVALVVGLPTDPDYTTAEGQSYTGGYDPPYWQKGVLQKFKIQARDTNGDDQTTGGNTFLIEYHPLDGQPGPDPQYYTDNGDGTYSAYYKANEAGRLKCVIKLSHLYPIWNSGNVLDIQ